MWRAEVVLSNRMILKFRTYQHAPAKNIEAIMDGPTSETVKKRSDESSATIRLTLHTKRGNISGFSPQFRACVRQGTYLLL